MSPHRPEAVHIALVKSHGFAGFALGVVAADELRPAAPVGGLHEQRPAPGVAGQQLGSALRERRLEPVEHRVGGHAALWHRQPVPGRIGAY